MIIIIIITFTDTMIIKTIEIMITGESTVIGEIKGLSAETKHLNDPFGQKFNEEQSWKEKYFRQNNLNKT